MARVPPLPDVEALYERLREQVAELHPRVVADVARVFVEVSSLPCAQLLWSLEFAFDEDDGRIARLEARFADHGAPNPFGEALPGYVLEVLLPNVIPARAPADAVRTGRHTPASEPASGSLVARFVRALAELGAYQAIETLEARSAEAYLL